MFDPYLTLSPIIPPPGTPIPPVLVQSYRKNDLQLVLRLAKDNPCPESPALISAANQELQGGPVDPRTFNEMISVLPIYIPSSDSSGSSSEAS